MQVNDSNQPAVEEILHGVSVGDPYRWLENRTLPETKDWIRNQQRRCDRYFARNRDLDAIRRRVRTHLDIETIDQPTRMQNRYFYRRRRPGESQGCIYVRETITGMERMLFDPSAIGPFASAAIHQIADDGSLLAYELRSGGSERSAIHILDVSSGRTLPGHVPAGYLRGFSFDRNIRGFFYCQQAPGALEDLTIRTRRLRVPPQDATCFCVPQTEGGRLFLTADARHLGAIRLHQNAGRSMIDFWIASRDTPTNWTLVFANRAAPCLPFLRHGRLFALSSTDSINSSLAELGPDGQLMRTIIPPQQGMIRQLVVVGDRFYVNLFDRMRYTVQCWTLDGSCLGSLNTPAEGTIDLLSSRSYAATSLFYTHESLTEPLTTFELTPETGMTLRWHQRDRVSGAHTGWVRRSAYPSTDGTEIPISIVEPRTNAIRLLGCPAIMTGYGGFGTPMTQRHSALVAILVDLGAVFLLPHIRGGGELGKQWHDSACRRKRQVAFDDFIAAAEWACSQNLATPRTLGIFGGSNSGLLVGVAVTQRPDLFRAGLCIAPLLDMVRYESFDPSTRWQQEYGTVADAEDFSALYAYSPYHHVRRGTSYPAMMFVTGDQDERCSPAHVRKMAARLQEEGTQRSPVIVDYSDQRGHSPTLPLEFRVDALARRIAFLCQELSIPVTDGG
jgi:prolyl oligopeptidase